MTIAHLVLASLLTAYMLVAVVFEERDLERYHGRVYQQYRRRVPMFIPRPGTGVRSETDLLPVPEPQSVSR